MDKGWTWGGGVCQAGGGEQGAPKSKSDDYKRTQELDFSESSSLFLQKPFPTWRTVGIC